MPSLLRALLFVLAFSCFSNKHRFDAHYRFKLIYSVILLLVQNVHTTKTQFNDIKMVIQSDEEENITSQATF